MEKKKIIHRTLMTILERISDSISRSVNFMCLINTNNDKTICREHVIV